MSAVETFTGTHFYFFYFSGRHGVIRLFSEQIHRNQIVLKEGHLLVHLWIIFNTGAFLESLKLLLGHHFALQEFSCLEPCSIKAVIEKLPECSCNSLKCGSSHTRVHFLVHLWTVIIMTSIVWVPSSPLLLAGNQICWTYQQLKDCVCVARKFLCFHCMLNISTLMVPSY